jgi:nanoRNase/pAp phosphatase (c-di-AMP/oligoRNAs hydrolase)
MRRSERAVERLLDELNGVRGLLIMIHDHPDPDALASGWVLRHLLRHKLGLRATLAYEGIVGRAENRAMVDHLRIPLVPFAEVDPYRYDAIALIDTQPATGNNSLPADLLPRVVVDHHPMRPATRPVPFCDVRPDYGATATIVTEYLQVSGLDLPPRYATALFYAIRSETQNLGRDSANPDTQAFLSLFPRVDNRVISRIEQAPLSRRYLGLLDGAFRATRLYGDLAITTLDRIPYPDVPAELADLLLRVDRVRWALAMGIFRGEIYLSMRTSRPRGNAARMMKRAVGEHGKAGGHGMMAGGKIIPRRAGLPASSLLRRVARRAREVLGVAELRGEALLRRRGCAPG